MNSNFNLVKKPKKDENEFDTDEEEDIELEDDAHSDDDLEEDEDDEEVSTKASRSYGDDAKKKMFMLMGVIVIGTIFLLLILFIASLFTSKIKSYSDIETIMKEAAISYFKDYPDSLPKEDGDIVEIDSSNLVAAGKMKAISEYTEEGVACTGTVQVTKVGSDYVYTPYLNCGDNYVTIELYRKVLENNQTVKSGDGLYVNGNNYIFRGENVNNYVKLDNSVWRIVKITSDSQMVLVHADGVPLTQPWDNRYNEERLYESGINTYSVSRIKDYLEKIYKEPSKDDGEVILSSKDKTRINTFDLCIGKRNPTGESKNNSEECKLKDKDQKIGLLTVSEYLYASLDPNCKSADTKSCMNYNYLTMDEEWWLVTANSEDTSTVFKVAKYGAVEADIAGNYATVRPVIYLKSNVMFKSGKGTEEKPYKVK